MSNPTDSPASQAAVLPYSQAADAGRPSARGKAIALAVTGLVVAAVATAVPMYAATGLRSVPPGTSVRPFALAMVVLVFQAVACMAILPAIMGLWIGRRSRLVWTLAVVALALVPMPAFGTRWMVYHLAARHGFTIGD